MGFLDRMKKARALGAARGYYLAMTEASLPEPHAASRPEISTIWDLGKWLIDQRKYTIAIALLQPYEYCGHAGLCNSLGVAWGKSGNWGMAYYAHKRAHKLQPNEDHFLFTFGMAAYRTGRTSEASELYQAYMHSGSCTEDKRQWIYDMMAEGPRSHSRWFRWRRWIFLWPVVALSDAIARSLPQLPMFLFTGGHWIKTTLALCSEVAGPPAAILAGSAVAPRFVRAVAFLAFLHSLDSPFSFYPWNGFSAASGIMTFIWVWKNQAKINREW